MRGRTKKPLTTPITGRGVMHGQGANGPESDGISTHSPGGFLQPRLAMYGAGTLISIMVRFDSPHVYPHAGRVGD